MIRAAVAIFLLILSGFPLAASAQKPASPPAISADQARQALDVLNDPAKRAAFTATLNAIVKAQPAASAQAAGAVPATGALPATGGGSAGGAAPAEPAKAVATSIEGLTIPLAPDSLGAQVLVSASSFVNRLGNQAVTAMDTVQSLPLLWGWAVVMVTNPLARDLLVEVTWRVALALVAAILVEYGLRRATRRPIRSLEARAPVARASDQPGGPEAAIAAAEAGDLEPNGPARHRPSAWTFLRRVPLVLARLLLELVPVLGIAVIGHLIAGSWIGGQTVSRLIILAVIDAYALSAALLCVARMVLSPTEPRLRLFHLQDSAAAYLMRWTRRLVLIAVVGYAVGEAWLLLGLSEVAHEALQKAVGFVLHACLAVIILQSRVAVRDWLSAPATSTGPAARVRNRLAAAWHWVALFFVASVWLVYAIELPHGYTFVLHYFVVTAALLIGTRLTLLLVLGGLDRLAKPPVAPAGATPLLGDRLHAYLPVVVIGIRLAIYGLCALGLLQLYGLNTFVWLLSSDLGLRILGSSGTLVLTIVLAFAAWEAINSGVQQHLDRLQREAQLAKSARLRTLLPLLRTTLLVTLAIIAGLMVLSEIGINIAPLLAGAGILGVAIGFGSQKLVQDLITGIFLLLENAMQVGDVVSVGGLAGVVESLSVRTIRLRSEDGSVFLIPFSSVTTVTNMTRDYSRAVIVASVAYKEDYDRVVEVLKGIANEMRADAAWQSIILDDLEVWGLDQFGDSSVNIKCRIMCTRFGRWSVLREFNRRMKMRFDECGIEIPFPHRKLIMEDVPTALPVPLQEAFREKQPVTNR